MSNDTELFELCSSVYVKTGWADESIWNMGDTLTPIYTTDYLLEKLPRMIKTTVDRIHKEHGCITCDCERSYQTYLEVHQSDTKSLACYVSSLNSRAIPFLELADTTTKALLKLTLALLEAGINLKEPSDV